MADQSGSRLAAETAPVDDRDVAAVAARTLSRDEFQSREDVDA
ncbi:hypothetical protein [Streptomyces anatolicus]|nr:hypothetical protein [Streptomyces anatolicus]